MQHVNDWFEALAKVIQAGGTSNLNLILAVLILLAALGAFFSGPTGRLSRWRVCRLGLHKGLGPDGNRTRHWERQRR